MFDSQAYLRVLSAISAALTTLLGSVGIFVSLTVQRRVEKLQDILEEFLDLSYHSDTNISGKIFKLIEKYQMHYLFPDTPGKMIIQYINFTIITVVVSWTAILAIGFHSSCDVYTLIFLAPVFMGLGILILYRFLLKNAIYPFGNNLMSPLIPPPVQLRSVSFLSSYVNVSVKSVLRQARLRLLIKTQHDGRAKVILKEELSFDDYFYYVLITAENNAVFVAYGELKIEFNNETITGKPIPVAKNISIPLGYFYAEKLLGEDYQARFFIFPRGEKHPLEYQFNLRKQGDTIIMSGDPEISINYMVTYTIEQDRFRLIEESAEIPYFRDLTGHFKINKKRFACCQPFSEKEACICEEEIYID